MAAAATGARVRPVRSPEILKLIPELADVSILSAKKHGSSKQNINLAPEANHSQSALCSSSKYTEKCRRRRERRECSSIAAAGPSDAGAIAGGSATSCSVTKTEHSFDQELTRASPEALSRSVPRRSTFTDYPPKCRDGGGSTMLKSLELLELVEELRDQLSKSYQLEKETRRRCRLSHIQDTFFEGCCPRASMPVSGPNLHCNNSRCAARSRDFCWRSSRHCPLPNARPAKRYFRPLSGGAPFVICSECFEVLHVPADFVAPTSRRRRRSSKLKCGACSVVMVLPSPARSTRTSDEAGKPSAEDSTSSSGEYLYEVSFADCSPVEATEAEAVSTVSVAAAPEASGGAKASGATLHQLMGYGSPSELLF